jgi:choice-of-anchor A domain-containing protein
LRRALIKVVGFVLLAMAPLAIGSPAMAATSINTKAYDALVAMKSLNVITLGNYNNTGNGDIEGKLWVGGDSSGSKLQVGFGNANQNSGQSSSYKTMTVIGNFTNSGVDLYNGTTKNGTVGTSGGSSSGSYGLKVGGNMTDSNNGLNTKANGASITVGGYVNRMSLDGANQTVTVNGLLQQLNVNASNSTIKAGSYSGNTNGLGSGSTVSISGANPNSGNTPPTGWSFNQTSQTLGAPTTSSMQSDKSTMISNITALTSQLSTLSDTLSASKIGAGGNSTAYDLLFNVTSTTKGYAVFNVSASDLFSARNIGFQFGSGTSSTVPIIVNITGLGSGTYNWNLQSGVNGYGSAIYDSSLSSQLIWNLVGATGTLNVNTTMEGSVISATGTVSTSSSANIEGTVVASVFNQGGEVHLGTFNGGDSGNTALTALSTVSTGAVPETQTWITMIIGFGFIGAVIRRQKQAIMLLRL